jgi:hypothetical protein
MIILDDTESKKMLYSLQCPLCKRFHESEALTCDAFTEGIPDKILWEKGITENH